VLIGRRFKFADGLAAFSQSRLEQTTAKTGVLRFAQVPGRVSVVFFEVHAGVHAGDLVAVAVEHLGGNGVGQEAGVDAALVGLGPAGVVVVGIDVGVEAVLLAVGVVPGGVGLFVGEVEFDDGFGGLEAVLPGDDDADGSAVLVGQDLAVAAEGEEGEGVHGLVHAKAFGVGPVVAGGEVGHLLCVLEGDELDVFGAGEGLAEVDELGEGVAVPGDDHGPGFDAAVAVDAAFERAVVDEVVDVDGLGLFDHAGDLDGPGAGLQGVGVAGRVGFVGAELVEVVVGSGSIERGLGFGGAVFAGDGLELVGGVDGGAGVEDVGEVAGGESSGSEGGGSGEEAAAVLLVLLEDVLGGDLRGADGAGEAWRLAEKHGDRFPLRTADLSPAYGRWTAVLLDKTQIRPSGYSTGAMSEWMGLAEKSE